MGIFKRKAKKNKGIPRNSKLFGILRGIDETEIQKARKMQGFDQCIKIENDVQSIKLVDIKNAIK